MKKIISLVVTCCLLFSMVSCDKSSAHEQSDNTSESIYDDAAVSEFLSEVDANNVSDAKTIYRNEINGDSELENDVYTELLSRLESAVNDYNNTEISDNEATVIFDTISALSILHDNDITPLRDLLNQLISSKAAFESAEVFFNSEDYYNAYQQYLLVIADDINYSTAVSQASTAADEYVSSVIEQVEASRSELDYISAITEIREAVDLVPNNQNLITEQTLLEAEYLQYALDTAEAAHQDGNNYSGAMDIIYTAMTLLSDDQLDQALEYYASFEPVNLLDLDAYYEDGYFSNIISASDYDRYGNTYQSGWEFETITPYHCSGTAFDVYYELSRQYSRLTGVITPGDKFEVIMGDDRTRIFTRIDIYADDVLIYTETTYFDNEPVYVDLDITNVDMLHINIYEQNQNNAGNFNDESIDYETYDIDVMYADFLISKTI